jgi:hypothetical protein
LDRRAANNRTGHQKRILDRRIAESWTGGQQNFMLEDGKIFREKNGRENTV